MFFFTTLPKQQEKWSFLSVPAVILLPKPITLAHSQQQNESFVLLGRTTARCGTKHKPASPAMVQELFFPDTLPNSRLCFCAAAGGISLHGFCIWQLRMNPSKQRAADSKHSTGFCLMLLELPVSSHGLLFLPGDGNSCCPAGHQLDACHFPGDSKLHGWSEIK